MMTAAKDERPSRERTYSITELCREFNVTPRTLRFYEQKGLLSPARRGWTRLFSYRDRARLQLILRGKRVGFSLEEIKRSEEHTSELQSRLHLVCRLLLEKKKKKNI